MLFEVTVRDCTAPIALRLKHWASFGMSQWGFTASTPEKMPALPDMSWQKDKQGPRATTICGSLHKHKQIWVQVLDLLALQGRREQTVQQSNTEWHDVPRHCRTEHATLVLPGSCGVLCWGSEEGSPEGQGLPAGTWQCQSNALHLQEHSRRESQLTVKAKGRTSRYCPKKSHYAKVSHMIQDRVRHQAACQRLVSAQNHYCTTLLTWLCDCFICTQIQSNSVKLQPERPVL